MMWLIDVDVVQTNNYTYMRADVQSITKVFVYYLARKFVNFEIILILI